jgi:flagellar biosynthetic protein FliP
MRADRSPLRAAAALALALAGTLACTLAAAQTGGAAPGTLPLLIGQGAGGTSYSVPVQTLLFFTALSFLPAVLLLMTAFTRIVIVLSLLRQALGTQAAPPNQVIIGLSLFLTFFVMSPTLDKVYEQGWQPYAAGQASAEQAMQAGVQPLREFMLKNTRQSDVMLFARLAKLPPEQELGANGEGVPLRVLVPAFVTSELKSAFQIGFDLHPVPDHRHDRRQRADEPGDDDAQPGAGGAAVQAHAVRAGRRLEPAAGLAGSLVRHLAAPALPRHRPPRETFRWTPPRSSPPATRA